MTRLLTRLLGRIPIGWLQLRHSRGRLFAAIAGIAFANLLVFVQLGIQGAMATTGVKPYSLFDADILLLPSDGRTFSDGGNVPRQRMFEALGIAGVSAATPLFIGLAEWRMADGTKATLEVYGTDPASSRFLASEFAGQANVLSVADAAVIDVGARGFSGSRVELVGERFEFNGRSLRVADTVEVGGGFTADGVMLVSDQTFLRLFPNRSSGAPNRILIQKEASASIDRVVERLRVGLDTSSVRVLSIETAIADDLAYQTTERPTGIIFGFGVLMGVMVGVVIVYQVLSTDVANHIREYATFKAMGYSGKFFLGIIIEQALVLAVLGFIPGLFAALGLYAVLSGATGLPVNMDAARAMFVFFGTVCACILSGALAMRKVATADPADLF